MHTNIKNIKSFPHKITLNNSTYFIVKENDDYYLVSNVCPHQGGEIIYTDKFECKVHGWQFDSNGDCINVPSKQLYKKKLDVKDGIAHLEEIKNKFKTKKILTGSFSPPEIEFKVHAHSCVEIGLD